MHYIKAARERLLGGYGLTLALALGLVLCAGAIPGLQALDNAHFRLIEGLREQPSVTSPLRVVRLPDDGDSVFQSRLTAIEWLEGLLDSGALPGRARAAALVLDEGLHDALVWSESGRALAERLATSTVLVGLPATATASAGEPGVWPNAAAAEMTPATVSGGPLYRLLGQHAAILPQAYPWAGLDSNISETLSLLPVFDSRGEAVSRPLVWALGDRAVPDLAAQLYAGPSQPAVLERGQLHLGEVAVATDPFGRLYPRLSRSLQRWPEISETDLWQFTRRSGALPGEILIIGIENDPVVDDLAAAVASLHAPALAHTPLWGIAAEKAVTLLFCLYLLIVLPHLRASVAVLASGLVAVVTAAAQMGVYLLHSEWVPLAAAFGYLLIGHLIVTLTAQARRHWQALRQRADEAHIQLAHSRLQHNELDAAERALRACTTSEEVLPALYELGIAYERRRNYDKAAAVFAYILQLKRGYRDVSERLHTLTGLNAGQGWMPGRSLPAATLVLPEHNVAKPVLGRYELEKELGRGAAGVVYLGTDPKIGRQVAIKTLDMTQLEEDLDEFRSRFFREAEAAGRLSHPNIVTVFDVGEERDLAFIAMDYMPGKPLSAYTAPDSLLPPALVHELIAQVADALAYAHRQGVVHRDIKPENLIYNEAEGRVKITDFGIARLADTTRTRTGAILGSPSYMSPEQISGGRVDGRSDIFSLGVTFFQLLTGELPFQGDTLAALAYQISNHKHRDIRELCPELPASTQRIINKALQKAPDKRYASAAELAAALRKSAASLVTNA